MVLVPEVVVPEVVVPEVVAPEVVVVLLLRTKSVASVGGTDRQKAACASKLILGGKAQQRNERQCC